MFPDHFDMLRRFLTEDSQSRITNNPGTVESMLVMGLWLERHKRIAPQEAGQVDCMAYHHLLTLNSVFHPLLSVRNVATTLAGLVLHSDPDDLDKLKILEDLLENCIFVSLQACAVSWLREELIIAQQRKLANQFSSSESIERLQYVLFPNVAYLKDVEIDALWDYWVQNYSFHLQVANFSYFLFASNDYKHLIPAGMGSAIEQRYVDPLLSAARTLETAFSKGELDGDGMKGEMESQLAILTLRLKAIPLQ
jgi:Uncharacterised protein family, YAP/Alf4/glomulin